MRKFYMVWVEGRPSPTKKHDNFSAAHEEMKRLARIERGRKVYVLEACSSAIADDLKLDGMQPMPF